MSAVVSLEVTSTEGTIGQLTPEVLRVKLCKQVDTDAAAITIATSGGRQIDRSDCLDNTSNFRNSTLNEERIPANIGGNRPTISGFLLRFGTGLRRYFGG